MTDAATITIAVVVVAAVIGAIWLPMRKAWNAAPVVDENVEDPANPP